MSRDSVLAALQPLSEVMPPEVFSAQPGDAISILGDDFLVSGKIDVDGRPLSFRLFRIARDPEEWLLVGREPDSPMVRMTPADAALAARRPETNLRQTDGWEQETARSSASVGRAGCAPCGTLCFDDADDPEAYGLILDWDGERQAFAGRRTEPIDVEVFRRTETAG